VETEALATALTSAAPPVVLDVRTPEEYAQGHVPAAKNIPVDTLADNLAGLDKSAEVYVICQSGRRSAAASSMLAEHGYHPVNVNGGTAKWIAEGRPVEK
jgi:hydroxyacylglutathione hydrolase